jgi:hypothetical protein
MEKNFSGCLSGDLTENYSTMLEVASRLYLLEKSTEA